MLVGGDDTYDAGAVRSLIETMRRGHLDLVNDCRIALVAPIFATVEETQLVPRMPMAVLATGMTLPGFFSLARSLILVTVPPTA